MTKTPPTAAKAATPKLYTIAPGVSFADSFAAKLLQQYKGDEKKLPELLVLLPTRRACRIVQDSFLRQSGGVAMLLPRLEAFGDIDEEALEINIAALSAGGAGALDIPPALSPLRRRIILTRLILARDDYKNSPDQALLLADALGHLLDTIYTEGLDIATLPDLVDRSKFSQHWQITIDFLTIISVAWPQILAEMGYIDAADRRNRVLQALAGHWEKHPPTHPVIAAGSTGSIPAAGNLLHVIATMPTGSVVLPGLDLYLDEASWRGIDETHPQATMSQLLQRMGVDRSAVLSWDVLPRAVADAEKTTESKKSRQNLATELMRPATATDKWRDLSGHADHLVPGLEGLERIDCTTAQEEARLISLIFRYVQHNPPMTGVLITPDRALARRVCAACSRWGLMIDDSAGLPLTSSAAGAFLSLCVQVCAEKLAPVPLLGLLKHKLSIAGMDAGDFRAGVRRLDHYVLRGPRPAPGIEGLREQAATSGQAESLQHFLTALETCLTPMLQLCDGQYHSFSSFVTAHLAVAEAIAGGPNPLWSGVDGDAAASFFANLQMEGRDLPDITAADYLPMLETLMGGVTVRPAWGTNPRLNILGPLEARMLNADIVVLGSMNEGSWPPAAENDPWMSRPMRKDFGLPALERKVGLSSHDFVQGFCAPRVIMTRAERSGTAPTIPSRWLQRLDAVLKAANLSMDQTDWLEKTRSLDRPEDIKAATRPEPRPPLEKRPKRLSVTEIETWMRDPYAVYAKHVLNLKPIDKIDELPGAAERGTIIHKALEDFTKAFPRDLPANALDQILAMGHDLLDSNIKDVRTLHFWNIRFDKAAEWFISNEAKWRTQARNLKNEIKDEITVPGHDFTLVAKADRIDIMADGSGVAIIDYKTGSIPAQKDIIAGISPQLPLEAAMIRAGGFKEIDQRMVGYLGHWSLTGKDGGKEVKITENIDDLADAALSGLQDLIATFVNENTPYLSTPRPEAAPRFSDYRHLARIQEWAVLDEDGSEGEA